MGAKLLNLGFLFWFGWMAGRIRFLSMSGH
jgi:hypothetical protein